MDRGVDSESPPATPVSFSRPRPRAPRTPEQAAKVRVQNRRREYLEKNPGYFSSAEHEFAGESGTSPPPAFPRPLGPNGSGDFGRGDHAADRAIDPDLYDKLVRRFQTPAEREAEGRARGWGKTLESSLMRGEARLERLASSYTGDRPPPPSLAAHQGPEGGGGGGARRDTIFAIDSDLADDGGKPASKEEGRARWEAFLRERFVRGGDEDFEYDRVDRSEDLDSMEARDREEAYFDEVEPEWADDSGEEVEDDEPMDGVEDGSGRVRRPKRERILLGQTGIQDY